MNNTAQDTTVTEEQIARAIAPVEAQINIAPSLHVLQLRAEIKCADKPATDIRVEQILHNLCIEGGHWHLILDQELRERVTRLVHNMATNTAAERWEAAQQQSAA